MYYAVLRRTVRIAMSVPKASNKIIKPLTDHKASILDAYMAAHSTDRVLGYLDAIADLTEYVRENVLYYPYPNQCTPSSPSRVRTELIKFCEFCEEMITAAPSRIAENKAANRINDPKLQA